MKGGRPTRTVWWKRKETHREDGGRGEATAGEGGRGQGEEPKGDSKNCRGKGEEDWEEKTIGGRRDRSKGAVWDWGCLKGIYVEHVGLGLAHPPPHRCLLLLLLLLLVAPSTHFPLFVFFSSTPFFSNRSRGDRVSYTSSVLYSTALSLMQCSTFTSRYDSLLGFGLAFH